MEVKWASSGQVDCKSSRGQQVWLADDGAICSQRPLAGGLFHQVEDTGNCGELSRGADPPLTRRARCIRPVARARCSVWEAGLHWRLWITHVARAIWPIFVTQSTYLHAILAITLRRYFYINKILNWLNSTCQLWSPWDPTFQTDFQKNSVSFILNMSWVDSLIPFLNYRYQQSQFNSD